MAKMAKSIFLRTIERKSSVHVGIHMCVYGQMCVGALKHG